MDCLTANADTSEGNPFAAPRPAQVGLDEALLTQAIDPAVAIVAEGVTTEEDFHAAQSLHHQFRRVADFVPWMVILFVLGMIEAFFVLDGADLIPLLLIGALIAMTLCVLLVNVFLPWLYLPRIAARRVWNKHPSLRAPMRRLISPELTQTITPEINVTLRWSAYLKYRASERVALLYLAEHPRLFTLFPRGMFQNDEDWRRFLQLVRERLPEA